jgi:hypothetical protein
MLQNLLVQQKYEIIFCMAIKKNVFQKYYFFI